MKKNLIPKSKAANAYDLLSEVARAVTAEPKRLRMGTWLDTKAKRRLGVEAPACGTIGCIAGWSVMLSGSRTLRREMARGVYFNYYETPASGLLGLDEEQSEELFNTDVEGRFGTRAHARNAVRRIRAFQQKYATQLKAKAV
jgi:hypothetical protein